eukprot:TRINITY_DN4887_c1_g2_i1.p12 TRINITY_DN4887_c1_g2~~TRINITY_DN4887_c1_g2_i1.p12  ORF type:complete len:102 (+),score=8.55 TRINITY_DN4887_c1_g2_i1:219-524(+)
MLSHSEKTTSTMQSNMVWLQKNEETRSRETSADDRFARHWDTIRSHVRDPKAQRLLRMARVGLALNLPAPLCVDARNTENMLRRTWSVRSIAGPPTLLREP